MDSPFGFLLVRSFGAAFWVYSYGIDGGRFYASNRNEDPSNEYLTQQIVSFYIDALKSGAAEALR